MERSPKYPYKFLQDFPNFNNAKSKLSATLNSDS